MKNFKELLEGANFKEIEKLANSIADDDKMKAMKNFFNFYDKHGSRGLTALVKFIKQDKDVFDFKMVMNRIHNFEAEL
jgi:hypothetical protein